MTTVDLYTLSVAVTIVTGATAGLLSLLAWYLFGRSPLGQAVLALSFTMSVFILYHVVLVSVPTQPVVARVIESAAYTGVLGFILVMIRSQRRVRRHGPEGGP